MNERSKVGVGVIVVKDGRVLIGKRKGAHGEDTWSFPGGHLEFGETWEECAVREAREEAGLEIADVSFAAATNDIMPADGKHYITIYMLARRHAGEVLLCEPDRCERWEWRMWDDLPQPLFIPLQNLLRSGYRPSSIYRDLPEPNTHTGDGYLRVAFHERGALLLSGETTGETTIGKRPVEAVISL